MKFKKSIQRWGAWLLMKQFRLSEFNALLPVDAPKDLAELLAEDNAAPPYSGSRGLHVLRWVLFDPYHRNDEPSRGPQALVFSLVGDGNVQGVLASVLEHAGDRVRKILSYCRGFDARSDADVIAYLEKHRLKSQYLFRDIGPFFFPSAEVPADPTAPVAAPPAKSELVAALENLRTAVVLSFTQPPDPRPDPTVAELEDAFAIRQRFLEFLSERGGQIAAEDLRHAFVEAFEGSGFPHPLTPFERRLPHEESWTRRIIDTSRKVQEASARRGDGKLRRTIHAKGHGAIHAKLKVVPSENGVGLFSVQRTYDALLRPSNGASILQGDRARDARGLALRVLVPKDSRLGNGQAPAFLERNSGPFGYQDFVLMSSPVFFAPDARRLAEWFRVLELAGTPSGKLAERAMLLAPGGLRQTWIIAKTRWNQIRHPLATTYHSGTSYRYGDDHVAKYSVSVKDPARFKDIVRQKDPDSLKTALHLSLREGPIVLQLFVHLLRADAPLPLPYRSIQDIVEDATVDWEDLGVTRTHVADIEIARGEDPTSDARMGEAEQLQFNPWNALQEHRPLGSLNRARWSVYRDSQRQRLAGAKQESRPASGAASVVQLPGPPAPPPGVAAAAFPETAASTPPVVPSPGAPAVPPSGAAADQIRD